MPTEIDLASIPRGAISAPAGCGKTRLICDAISKHSGSKPILVLTHTNAGVGALKTRLAKRAPESAYRISTIDGWWLRLIAMFPAGAGLNPDILKLENPRSDCASWKRVVPLPQEMMAKSSSSRIRRTRRGSVAMQAKFPEQSLLNRST